MELTSTPKLVRPNTLPFSTVASLPTPARLETLPNLGYLDPLANGTLDDCEQYASGPVYNYEVDSFNPEVIYSCEGVAAAYDISLNDFLEWNPDLLETPGVIDECELQDGFRYCVQRVRPKSSGMTGYCVRETYVEPGWSCAELLFWTDISIARFAAWNPAVGPNCGNFKTGKSRLFV